MYVAKRKRVVRLPNREIDFGDFWIQDFIQPASYASDRAISEAWSTLMGLYRKDPTLFIRLLTAEELFNMYVKEMWSTVNVRIQYRYDDPVFQTPDFWLFPGECWKMQAGDCEDTSYMLLSAIYLVKRGWEAGNDRTARGAKAYGCIGFYMDRGTPYGHAFIIYSTPRILDGRWLWIETTMEDPMPQGTWLVADLNQLIPVYFFTDRECYRIDRDCRLLGLDEGYVSQYKSLINMMIDYVEAGKWTAVKWMHKKVRPARPTMLVRTA